MRSAAVLDDVIYVSSQREKAKPWRRQRIKPLPELFLHLHVLNPNCWENMTKHDWNGMQSNIALYFISESIFFCSFCWTFDLYSCASSGFWYFKVSWFQGTLNIHCVCVCFWNKSLEKMWCIVFVNMTDMNVLIISYTVYFKGIINYIAGGCGYLWLSSRSSSTASVSELSRSVTHTAVSSFLATVKRDPSQTVSCCECCLNYIPVLRYLKNWYHKKNKHRYSVWTSIPPSTN